MMNFLNWSARIAVVKIAVFLRSPPFPWNEIPKNSDCNRDKRDENSKSH